MKIRCPLCQYEMDTEDRDCRTGCPMGADCSLLCCPRCHYSFPVPESKVVNFVRSLFSKGTKR